MGRFFVPVFMLLLLAKARGAEELPAVQVSGRVKAVQTLIDRKVYHMADDVHALTGSVADLLNTLPSVEVDADGNLSLRGDANVTILIDGKPSTQLTGSKAGDVLTQLSARDIERIEVMTTPPAQYQASGTGGVINIITRRKLPAGPSGALQMSAGNHGRQVLAISGGYSNRDLKLSGGLGLREDDRQRRVRSSVTTLDSGGAPSAFSAQALDEHLRRRIPSLKLGAETRLNERQTLSANLSVRERDGDRFFDQTSDSHAADGSLLGASTRHSDGHEWSRSADQSLRFKQQLRQPTETLEMALRQSTDVEHERYAYLDTPSVPPGAATRDRLFLNHDLTGRGLDVDYARASTEGTALKLGFALQRDDNRFDNSGDTLDPATGLSIPNPALTNRFRYRQLVHALYASFQAAWSDWSTQAGLRAEQTSATADQLSTGIVGRQQYTGTYPSLRAERSLDETTTLSLGASKRLSRPDGEALNPFVDHQDIHNLRAGNATLRPQETQSFELGLRVEKPKSSYGLTAYLRNIHNSVTTVTQVLSPDVTLTTLTNLPLSRAQGLEFNREQSLGPVWSYRISGNAFRNEIDASALGFAGLRSTTGLNLKASLDYRPDAASQVQLSASRADKRLTPQGRIAAVNLVNLGLRRQMRPDLSLFATVSDLFNGQRFQRVLDTPSLIQSYQRQQVGRVIYIGLNYSFSGSKPGKTAGFDYDPAD